MVRKLTLQLTKFPHKVEKSNLFLLEPKMPDELAGKFCLEMATLLNTEEKTKLTKATLIPIHVFSGRTTFIKLGKFDYTPTH